MQCLCTSSSIISSAERLDEPATGHDTFRHGIVAAGGIDTTPHPPGISRRRCKHDSGVTESKNCFAEWKFVT